MSRSLRLGTRGSPLALWQANHIRALLTPTVAPRPVELVLIETEGDRVRDRALSQIGGDGVFTKEIQTALLDNRVDVAVHSLKDLPTKPIEGLVLAAVPERGPIGDVFVSRRYARFDDLPQGATVATSSLRRRAQLLHRRPDLNVVNLRGNVETRLKKLDEQNLDGIILAEAGLVRLNLAMYITEVLDRAWMLPAVGQGALGLECRADDCETIAALETLIDAPSHAAVLAERAMLRGLGGGCLVPIGAHGEVRDGMLVLRGCVLPGNGSSRIEATNTGPLAAPEVVGRVLAEILLGEGAEALLAE